MKDRQIEPSSGAPRIPILSVVLHCVAMTGLVYLRSSFGFVYLRPKSVFFAFSWAFVLFTIYAWNEPGAWNQHRFICGFGVGAVVLYWLHLLAAFSREVYHRGEHDHYSGRSHLLRAAGSLGIVPESRFETHLHLWGEPALLFCVSALLRALFQEWQLSNWLLYVAACHFLKEVINYWFRLRQRKRQEDNFGDAEESVEQPDIPYLNQEPVTGIRKERVKRARNVASEKSSS